MQYRLEARVTLSLSTQQPPPTDSPTPTAAHPPHDLPKTTYLQIGNNLINHV